MNVAEALAVMETWIGLTALSPDPAVQARQASVVMPFDSPAEAIAYLRTKTKFGYPSTCALVVMAYLRLLGVDHPRLLLPYLRQTGQAMMNVEKIGRAMGVFTNEPWRLSEYPDIGDVLRVDNAARNNAHTFVVKARRPANSAVFSIDGGQVEGTYTLPRERLVLATAGKVYLVSPDKPYFPDGCTPNGRELTGRLMIGSDPRFKEAA